LYLNAIECSARAARGAVLNVQSDGVAHEVAGDLAGDPGDVIGDLT